MPVPRGPAVPRSTAPLVSVLVPAYNHQEYIEETLVSIRDEGYENLEIVVVDDGSTDETWERITSWASANRDAVPLVSMRQENRGLTRTLNGLLDLGRGEYAAVVASDDRLLPGGIAARVAFLEARPHLSAVIGDCRVIDADGRVISDRGVGFGHPLAPRRMQDDPAGEIVGRWGVPGPVILYRRQRVRQIGGYAEDLLLEDWDLYLRLASLGEIAYIDQIVSEYRWHGENTAGRPELAVRLADELRSVAWRSRHLFRGRLYLELVHESASWAARSAALRRRPLSWVGWKAASAGLKLLAAIVPRRPSDQVGRIGQ